jgi:hypothetical protein
MQKSSTSKTKWKLVSEFPVVQYDCGARFGDHVRVRRTIRVRDHKNVRTGKEYKKGEIVEVLKGTENPRTIWLRMADGTVATWTDNAEFWKLFERVGSIKRSRN